MDELSTIASLLSDPGRAAIVVKLMGGVALPAGELARVANVAPPTASGHLRKMVEGGLLGVEEQGRHRYYRLRNAEVGEAVEALLRLTGHAPNSSGVAASHAAGAGTLAHARTCYSHLAGWLGVAVAEALVGKGLLAPASGKAYVVTGSGRLWLRATLAIEAPVTEKPAKPFARQCLDWTERRHHLAGELGVLLYQRLLALQWVAPMRSTRAVRTTLLGKQQLWKLLRIPLG